MSHSISNSERFLMHICRLLEEKGGTNALAQECLEAIEQSEVLLHPGGEFPIFHTLQVYRTRAMLHSGVRSGVVGYERLLPALECEPGPSVRLLSVTTRQGTYLLFTCAGADRLIGLLKTNQVLDDFLSSDPCRDKNFEIIAPLLATSDSEPY